MRFFIVDVFAEGRYSGNPLAVFLMQSEWASVEMQKIAAEINFSESIFIRTEQEEGTGWSGRIFTPAHEVDFAGHPSLGAAWIIGRELDHSHTHRICLHFKAGLIPVERSEEEQDLLWMEQLAPVFGEIHPAPIVADVLGLPPEAIDGRFPIQEVSTGLPHFLVPLQSLEFLKRAKVDRERYFSFIQKTQTKNFLVFCLQGRDASHQVSVRMFADYLGIPEDPATGSGNGCLVGYLVHYGCLGTQSVAVCSGQGHEIGRPSHLYLKAEKNNGGIRIRVGGKVVPIAQGHWPIAQES